MRRAGYLAGFKDAAEAVAEGDSSNVLVNEISGRLARLLTLRSMPLRDGCRRGSAGPRGLTMTAGSSLRAGPGTSRPAAWLSAPTSSSSWRTRASGQRMDCAIRRMEPVRAGCGRRRVGLPGLTNTC
jgi:hypothetical protein